MWSTTSVARPTYVIDLARGIIQLCRQNASGIVHVTNAGDCTWFEFAQEIVRSAGLTTTCSAGEQCADGAACAATGVFRIVTCSYASSRN